MFANLEFEANAVGGEEGDDHMIGVWFDWLLCFWHSHPPPQVTFTVKLASLTTSKAFWLKTKGLQNEQMGEGPMNAYDLSAYYVFGICFFSADCLSSLLQNASLVQFNFLFPKHFVMFKEKLVCSALIIWLITTDLCPCDWPISLQSVVLLVMLWDCPVSNTSV